MTSERVNNLDQLVLEGGRYNNAARQKRGNSSFVRSPEAVNFYKFVGFALDKFL